MYPQIQTYPGPPPPPAPFNQFGIYPAAHSNPYAPDINLRISDAYKLRPPIPPLVFKPLTDISAIALDFSYEDDILAQTEVDIVARGFNSLRSDELMDNHVATLMSMGYPLPAAQVAVSTYYSRAHHTSQQHNTAIDYCMRYNTIAEKVPKARAAMIIGALAKCNPDEERALNMVQSVV